MIHVTFTSDDRTVIRRATFGEDDMRPHLEADE
jgi:hypothetical protein